MNKHTFPLILMVILFFGLQATVEITHAVSYRETKFYDEIENAAYNIFDNSCDVCHGEIYSDYEGDLNYVRNLDKLIVEGRAKNFINCSNLKKSKIMVLVNKGDMPKYEDPLNDEQRQDLVEWIEHGCKKLKLGQLPSIEVAEPYKNETIKRAAWLSLSNHCSSCHNSRSTNNGGFYRILELEWLAEGNGPKPYVDRCNPDNSLILKMIRTESMPKGSPILNSHKDDIAAIEKWIDSLGTKALSSGKQDNELLRENDLFSLALANLNGLPSSTQEQIRFISLATPYNSGIGATDLRIFRLAVGKLMNMLSTAPRIVKPEVVDGTNELLLRIDLRDYGWKPADWEMLENTYPYGRIPFQGNNFPSLQRATNSKLPILRGDWLAFAASRPPLYYQLLRLPATEGELELQIGGSNNWVNRNIREFRVFRAGYGAGESGISLNSRLIERHDSPTGGMYWKSYDFGGMNKHQNLEQTPFGPFVPEELVNEDAVSSFEHDGGEFIFSLLNGLHGYYLATANGQRLNIGPSRIVQDSSRLDRTIMAGISCFSCHASGIQVRPDAIRDDILRNTSRFSPKSREIFSSLHPSPEKLLQIMRQDEQNFLRKLMEIGLAERTASGNLVPVLAIGGIEPVRYLSDYYEQALDDIRIAAEFGMTLGELERAAVGNEASTFVSDSSCERLPRATFEDMFAGMLPKLTTGQPVDTQQTELIVKSHVSRAPTSPLGVKIELPKRRYKIGDEFFFHISAKRDCKFIVFTIDSNGKVEVHDPTYAEAFMGPSLLKAGERRRIPIESNDPTVRNAAIIDPPAGTQQIGALCSIDGLAALGISDYQLKYPAKLGQAKFTFQIHNIENRFNQDQFSKATVNFDVE